MGSDSDSKSTGAQAGSSSSTTTTTTRGGSQRPPKTRRRGRATAATPTPDSGTGARPAQPIIDTTTPGVTGSVNSEMSGYVPGHTPLHVALYWPNIIGYYRVVLVIACVALHCVRWHGTFVAVYLAAASLDFVDGLVARYFGQCTKFGEVLDVVVDIAQRSTLWCLVASVTPSPLTACFVPLVVCIEWLTFAVCHARSMLEDTHWKARQGTQQPWFLRKLFANGFKNPLGATAIAGTFFLPLYLYCDAFDLVPEALAVPATLIVLLLARVVAGAAELWLVGSYLHMLLQLHANLVSRAATAQATQSKPTAARR